MLPVGNKASRGTPSAPRRGTAHRGTPVDPATDASAPALDPATPGRASNAGVAQQLTGDCGDSVVLLHHRRTPRVKPHLDHLAISPSGVWVVHSRLRQGRVATRKPMFGEPKLTIGGRERTDLLVNLERQVGYVRLALGRDHGDVQVRSAICFVDTPLPPVRTLHLGSYLFFGTESIAAQLRSDGPLTRARISTLAALLDERFPPVDAAA